MLTPLEEELLQHVISLSSLLGVKNIPIDLSTNITDTLNKISPESDIEMMVRQAGWK